MKLKDKLIIGICMTSLIMLVLIFVKNDSEKAIGSTFDGQAYNATTTRPTSIVAVVLKSASGQMGQITITASSSGSFILYDATTSDVTKRTGQVATTSLLIVGTVDAWTPTGTYMTDAIFYNGLLYVPGASVGTSTITWK